jgi:hypothetical protein
MSLQLNVLGITQWMIAFGNVWHQVFKELLLNSFNFFVWDYIIEKLTIKATFGFFLS